jgi:ketosteroid isomerase-like protein
MWAAVRTYDRDHVGHRAHRDTSRGRTAGAGRSACLRCRGKLTELLDDAVLFTGPDGNLYTKHDDLGAHRSGHQVLTRVEESELRVLVTGSTGVTWFLGTLEGSIGGEPFAAQMRYTRTWARNAETGWRIVAAHAMLVNAG